MTKITIDTGKLPLHHKKSMVVDSVFCTAKTTTSIRPIVARMPPQGIPTEEVGAGCSGSGSGTGSSSPSMSLKSLTVPPAYALSAKTHRCLDALAFSTSTRERRIRPRAKKPTTDRMAGRPEPVTLLTTAKTNGPQIAENLEKTE